MIEAGRFVEQIDDPLPAVAVVDQRDIAALGASRRNRLRAVAEQCVEQLGCVDAVEEGVLGARVGEVAGGCAADDGAVQRAEPVHFLLEFDDLAGIAESRAGGQRRVALLGQADQLVNVFHLIGEGFVDEGGEACLDGDAGVGRMIVAVAVDDHGQVHVFEGLCGRADDRGNAAVVCLGSGLVSVFAPQFDDLRLAVERAVRQVNQPRPCFGMGAVGPYHADSNHSFHSRSVIPLISWRPPRLCRPGGRGDRLTLLLPVRYTPVVGTESASSALLGAAGGERKFQDVFRL